MSWPIFADSTCDRGHFRELRAAKALIGLG